MIYYILFFIDYLIIYILSIFKKIINKGSNVDNLYVSLTTIPSRSNNLLFTINSILNQTIIPKKIFITISKNNIREKNLKYNIHNKIKNHPLIQIIEIEEDNGPINKLYGGIINCKNNDDIFVTVDDDSIYHRFMLENLYNSMIKYKHKAIGTIGRINYNQKIFGYSSFTDIKVKMLEGYGGVGYRKNFFTLRDIDTKELQKEVIFNDDIYISYILKNKNIDLILVPSQVKEPLSYTLFTRNTNPLWIQNEDNKLFNKCLQTLQLNNI